MLKESMIRFAEIAGNIISSIRFTFVHPPVPIPRDSKPISSSFPPTSLLPSLLRPRVDVPNYCWVCNKYRMLTLSMHVRFVAPKMKKLASSSTYGDHIYKNHKRSSTLLGTKSEASIDAFKILRNVVEEELTCERHENKT